MMQNRKRWMITDDEKDMFIDALTNELSALRAKAGVAQDEIAKLIGISRQTYGAIERKTRRMSWNTYLSLILFFDYTMSTHKMLRRLSAFPTKLINRFNEYKKNNEIDDEMVLGISFDDISENLDERGLHAIRTVVMMEYLRCNNLSSDVSLDKKDVLNNVSNN